VVNKNKLALHNRWQTFYQAIRDESWPDCYNEHHFYDLPSHIQEEILHVHNGGRYLSLQDDDIEYYDPTLYQTDYGGHNHVNVDFDKEFKIAPDFSVYYAENMEGNGTNNGQDFPNVVRHFYPDRVFDHCLDWCSAAGFIGFRLLSDGICDRLTLQDCYRPAIDACHYTMARMPEKYKTKVTAVCSDSMSYLTPDMKFDLVIGNPPPLTYYPEFKSHQQNHIFTDWNRINVDPDWRAHIDFLTTIGNHLTQDGVILIKSPNSVSIKQFEPHLDKNGLKMIRAFKEKFYFYMWYIEIGKI
jgi:hypothetical protein